MAGKVTPLDKQKPLETQNDLVTYDVSSIWSGVGRDGDRYNPDDLIGRKGIGIYSKMLVDDQVKAATEFKLAAIMARGYEFGFDDSTKLSKEQQAERINIVWKIIDAVTGSFDTCIENVACGREFGFSVTEKVLTEVMIDGRAYTGINKLVLRDPSSFTFKADDYGELKGIRQNVSAREVDVDPRKVIHYVHKPKWDQFYGRSELRAAYDWWYIKQQVMRMWPMFLEKFAGGVAVASQAADSQGMSATEKTALQDALKNMKAISSVIMPKGIELEVLFPTTTDAYEKCITFCDQAIARSQLVPNLLGVSHTGQTGAFAQSQTQFEGFLWTIKQDGNALAECLNEQLFRPLFDINFGDKEYPWFKFKPASFEHVKWILSTWKDLLGAKAVVASEQDEAYIRKLLEMPSREPDEVLINPVEQANQEADRQLKIDALKQGAQQTAGQQLERSLRDQLDQLAATITSKLTNPVNVTVNSPVDARTETHSHGHGEEKGKVSLSFLMDKAAERVNFAVIEQRTEAMAATHINELATIIAKAARRALGTEENMRQLMDNEPSDVIALDINAADRGKLRSACKELLNDAWNMGSNMASNEMDRARKSSTPEMMRAVKFKALRDNAVAYFDNQSFRMAGDASDQTRKIIQQALQNGIKYGKPISEVRADIWFTLVSRGMTLKQVVEGIETDTAVNAALNKLWADTEDKAAAYLNTVVRTNTFEAFNEARFAEFSDPELADFVLALRYSAVMDSSTTEICRALDGSVWKTDSEMWNKYRCPNHWNCRSVLIPITAIDGWDGQESDPPTVEPQEGFK